jgi:hypothetical protein
MALEEPIGLALLMEAVGRGSLRALLDTSPAQVIA